MESPTESKVREVWEQLAERKGEPPTVNEVMEITGGNRSRVNEICGECKAEYFSRKRTVNDELRKKFTGPFETLLAFAAEHTDLAVLSIQKAHAAGSDALVRERDSFREQLRAAQETGRQLGEENTKLRFDLQGARDETVAKERARAELDAQVRTLLQDATARAAEAVSRESEIGRLRAELQQRAEDTLRLAEERFEAKTAELDREFARRRKPGLK
jgi:hypothetical protein